MSTGASNRGLLDILTRGHSALMRELGPSGYILFMREMHPGFGDFTKERHEWVDRIELEELFQQLDRKQAGSDAKGP